MKIPTLVRATALASALMACDKPGTATPDRTASSRPVASVAPVAPPAASASAAPVPASAAPAGSATPSSAPVASPVAPVKASAAPPPASASGKIASSATPAAEPLVPARARVEGKNFALEVSSPGCRVETDCTVTLRLAAEGGYHVNKEYPHKFAAQAAPTHTFLGRDDPNTFSKAAGDYREEGEKASTMTVRFRAKSAGEAKITGTYKMSVCSAENCQIEAPRVELAVTVK